MEYYTYMNIHEASIHIIELPAFKKKFRKILNDDEQEEFIEYLAENPKSGDVIPSMGGIRKIRWAASGKGKRRGVRVIYYYHVIGCRVFLLDIYKKNEREDMSPQAKKIIRNMIKELTSIEGDI